jgi:hypothetical protein
MGLVQVNKTVSGGSDTTLKVTGIDSDDVYLLVLKLIQTQNNNEVINMRVTKSGTADSTSNYDRASKVISSTSFSDSNYENGTGGRIMENVDDANGGGQGIFYLYNFNSSSEYSFWTIENVCTVSNQQAGSQGGGVHTVASASDGIEVYGSSGGTFISGASAILYKVV